MLPDEREVEREIRATFRADLELLAESIRETLGVLGGNQLAGTLGPGTDHLVVQLSMGLLTKAAKQARSVLILAEKGFGQDANSLARGMLETALATAFVLRKEIALTKGGKPIDAVAGQEFDSRFRARLYLANIAFERARTAREWQKVQGLETALSPDTIGALEEREKLAQEIIGPEWADRLKKGKSFSGLSVKDMAASLGLEQTYAVAYRSGSWSVHAADVDQFIDINLEDGPAVNLAPGIALVRESLVSATISLVMCLSFFDERLSVGAEVAALRLRKKLGLSS